MKKTISILLVLLISLCSATVFSLAADKASFELTSEEAKAGDTVTLDVNLTSNPGIQGITLGFIYDKENIEALDSVVDGKLFESLNGTALTAINFDSGDNTTATGKLCTVSFKVKETAPSKNYEITLKIVSCVKHEGSGADTQAVDVDFSASNGSINVKHEHEWNDGEVTKEATCTEAGVKTFTCAKCGETKPEEIPALGHKFGEWTVVKEATETEKGLQERVCSVCGKKETEEIPVIEPEKDNGGSKDNGGKGNTTTTTQPPKTTTPTKGGSIPKTGDAGVSLAVAGVIAAMSVAGVAIIMKKRNDD